MQNWDQARLAELSAGYDLDGGGYAFEPGPDAIPFSCVAWDNPDPDYLPWIHDVCRGLGRFGFHELSGPIYLFNPCFPFAPDEWPESYQEGEDTYRLVGHGILYETEHECWCNGLGADERAEAGLPSGEGCPRCADGEGYITSEGGGWALYDVVQEEEE